MATPAPAGANLRDERDRFVAFAFAAADLLLEVAANEEIKFVAGASFALTGHQTAEMFRIPFGALFTSGDAGLARLALRRARATGRSEPVPVKLARGTKPPVGVLLRGCRLPDGKDLVHFALSIAPEKPFASGSTEPRTGLLDAASFQDAVGALVGGAKDGEGRELTLLRVQGMEDFRTRSGDDATNQLLEEIGNCLRFHAGPGGVAGRLGEDSFGVVASSGEATAELPGQLRTIASEHDPEGKSLKIEGSSVDLAGPELSQADAVRALSFTLSRFVVSQNDGGAVPSLAQNFRAMMDETARRVSELRATMQDDRLTLVFQPIVALSDRAIHHYELLARFSGNRSTFETIQFAEGTGMIEEFDLMVCRRALQLLEAGTHGPSIELAVNVSARSITSDRFVEAFLTLLGQYPKLRSRLLIEVTESAQITNLPPVEKVLQTLRQAGHQVCLDDFGAGSSSFPYLQSLTVDFVKIDGAYVRRMMESARDRAILKGMVSICRDLEIETIAEMIETDTQACGLADLGVDFGQGYLFGAPAAAPLVISAGIKPNGKRPGFLESWL